MVPKGRLKLREGSIERNLIYYEREDTAGPKQSEIILVPNAGDDLKQILLKLFAMLAIVDKRREIYFIDNVKFHLDMVEGLGAFIEIEALDRDGSIGRARLQQQCERFLRDLNIREEDLASKSYSDLLLERQE